MKKKWISIAVIAVLTLGILAAMFTPIVGLAEEATTETAADTSAMTAEEMQTAIKELQATISELSVILQTLVARINSEPAPAIVTEARPAAAVRSSESRNNESKNNNLRGNNSQRPPRPVAPPISRERAIEIAFASVGGDGRLDDASLDYENGQWVWEVEIDFADRTEVELYIDVDTGEIIRTKWDD